MYETPNRPSGERGQFYSTTGHESTGYCSVWDRYPDTLIRRHDRFALYDPKGKFIGEFAGAMEAERNASFYLLDQAD